MADRAVLAHDILVLEHHPRPRAIVLAGVGPADEVDDLVGFDRAGARIHRIGPDAGEIIDLERVDAAVALYADLALAEMIPGMDVSVKTLDAVGDELDGPPQQL